MVNLTTAGFDKEYMLSVDPAMANYRGPVPLAWEAD